MAIHTFLNPLSSWIFNLGVWTVCAHVKPLNSLSPLMCTRWMDETDPWTLFVYQTESLVKYLPLQRGKNCLAVLEGELTGNTKSCVERQLMERKQSFALLAGQVSSLLWPQWKLELLNSTHTFHEKQNRIIYTNVSVSSILIF